MDLITLDFETFYSKEFSLSKLTTEEYIRDPRFQVIGLGLKVNNGPTEWASGTDEQMQDYLDSFDFFFEQFSINFPDAFSGTIKL